MQYGMKEVVNAMRDDGKGEQQDGAGKDKKMMALCESMKKMGQDLMDMAGSMGGEDDDDVAHTPDKLEAEEYGPKHEGDESEATIPSKAAVIIALKKKMGQGEE